MIKMSLKLVVILFPLILLTGCFGESYDFSPPSFSISKADSVEEEQQLIESNINWYHDEIYNKETEDIFSLAKKQEPMYFISGEELEYSLNGRIFDAKKIEISLFDNNNNKNDLKVNGTSQSFNMPKEKGEYIIVVELPGNHGHVQYVGNLIIK